MGSCADLCVDSALFGGVGYAIDREHVGCDTVVDVMRSSVRDNVVEAFGHDVVEALVDFGFGPEVAHAVLDPLEVAGGDAAGVGEDVRDDEDTLVAEDLVGDGSGGAVGALAEDAATDAFSVLAGDDVFGGCGDEDVALDRRAHV